MLLALLTSLALAVPTSLTHQGRLLDGDGRPVEGDHTLSFSLYDASTGGDLVWSETHVTPFSGGLYTVELGSTTPLDEDVFDGGRLFLELSVDGGPAMSPRHALTSVPYAQRAAVAGSVAYEDITGMPADLADGEDADTMGALLCGEGEVPKWAGAGWACGTDIDTDTDTDTNTDLLADISCLDGEVLVYDALLETWMCGTDADTTLSDDEVLSIVSSEGYALLIDLAPVALTGSYLDLTDVPEDIADGDDDTMGMLVCADDQVPVASGGSWVCGEGASTESPNHGITTLHGGYSVDNEIDLWNLKGIEEITGELRITATKLIAVELDDLQSVGELYVADNGSLETLSLDSLNEVVDNGFTIVNNDSLSTLEFPMLSYVAVSLTFDHNDSLESVSTPSMEWADYIKVAVNPNLVSLELGTPTVGLEVSITSNEALCQSRVDDIAEELTYDSFISYANDDGC